MSILLKDSKKNRYMIDMNNKEFIEVNELKNMIEEKYGFSSARIKVISNDKELANDAIVSAANNPDGLVIDDLKFPHVNIYYDKEVSKEAIDKLYQLTEKEKEGLIEAIQPEPNPVYIPPSKDYVLAKEANKNDPIGLLTSMGFEKGIASKALSMSENNVEIAIDLINEGLVHGNP